ncbi:hypothetical protein Dsin_024436 [Dipteronia sinensis]|uniref:Amino acid transporter transmembrane domain-containing protein n=1 Tax=Dipteronia sinensis TaxID=43782 RepID=A0AAE0DW95_9ROSI|nr:hypothetical protein Dsin_024436 [Dipteronia sinensis]
MAPELQKAPLALESGFDDSCFDDDGRVKRTGIDDLLFLNIGDSKCTYNNSSDWVRSVVTCMGCQLGWIAGPIVLIAFSIITWFTSALLVDSYRAVKRSNCFHKNGHEAGCHASNNMFMIIFGVIQIILSQIPNFHELSALSIIAAIMSFAYSLIGIGLSITKIADRVQDTLKSSPPENQEMKKATFIAVSVTTVFYLLCGTLGYAAFGNNAPGNFLTGFGFYEPFWLVDFANICIVVHLVGAYQVFCQPIYTVVEGWCSRRWPESKFITKGYPVTIPFYGIFHLKIFGVLGLLGAFSFWPLTVYFPIEMYISRAKIRRCSSVWIWLKVLIGKCLVMSLLAATGSIQGIIKDVSAYNPFTSIS